MTERFVRDPSIDSAIDVLPPGFYKSQREIYRAVENFSQHAASLHYQYSTPDTPLHQMLAPLSALETETEETHTVMSLSDIELALTPLSEITQSVTEKELVSAIQGICGHTITTLMTEAVLCARAGRQVNLVQHQTGMADYEAALIQGITDNQVQTQPIRKPSDITPFVYSVWQKLKTHYSFFKLIPNSTRKARIEGTQYSATDIADFWRSEQLACFEERLFEMHRKRIARFLESGSPFDDNPPLTIESNPDYPLEIEKLVICHKHFGAYKIQFKGQADFVTTHRNSETNAVSLVVIDQKYGQGKTLHSAPNRLQSLLYSDALQQKQFSKKNFTEVSPAGVMFLYHVFDTDNTDRSYYIDATVYPDKFPTVMNTLVEATEAWWMYEKEYKAIKFERQHAAVMPHLPKPNEEIRPVQFSMF